MEGAVVAAIIGAAATVTAAGIAAWKRREHQVDADPSVQVGGSISNSIVGSRNVSVAIHEAAELRPAALTAAGVAISRDGFARVLDVKLRNGGDETVFITRADFTVVGRWNIPQLGILPYAVPITGTYEVDLIDGVASLELAHGLEPQGVDRVEFQVACTSRDPDDDRYPFKGIFLFLIRIDLSYNEGLTLSLPLVLVHLPPPREIQGLSSGPPPKRDEVEKNKQTAREALAAVTDDIVVESPELLVAVRSWADADIEELFGPDDG